MMNYIMIQMSYSMYQRIMYDKVYQRHLMYSFKMLQKIKQHNLFIY